MGKKNESNVRTLSSPVYATDSFDHGAREFLCFIPTWNHEVFVSRCRFLKGSRRYVETRGKWLQVSKVAGAVRWQRLTVTRDKGLLNCEQKNVVS